MRERDQLKGRTRLPAHRDWSAVIRKVAEHADRAAFAEIFDYFTPRLEAFLRRLGLQPSTAEDIAQDVMVTLWRKASLFDPQKSSLATWLYRIARNRRIDLARRDRSLSIDPQSPGLVDLPDPVGAGSLYQEQQRDDIVRLAIRQLPAEQRKLLLLAFYDGLAHADIAARTGLPLGTVKSRIRLAYSHLRRLLQAAGIDEPGA